MADSPTHHYRIQPGGRVRRAQKITINNTIKNNVLSLLLMNKERQFDQADLQGVEWRKKSNICVLSVT